MASHSQEVAEQGLDAPSLEDSLSSNPMLSLSTAPALVPGMPTPPSATTTRGQALPGQSLHSLPWTLRTGSSRRPMTPPWAATSEWVPERRDPSSDLGQVCLDPGGQHGARQARASGHTAFLPPHLAAASWSFSGELPCLHQSLGLWSAKHKHETPASSVRLTLGMVHC